MDVYQHQLPYWLALNAIPDLTLKRRHVLRQFFGDLRELFTLSSRELKEIGLSDKAVAALCHPDWGNVDRQLQWAAQPNQHLMTWDHPHYPQALKEISDPPLVLWARGNAALLQVLHQIGIVGSRRPTAPGERNAYQFSQHLAKAGWVITSGLALGIDGIAHRAALDVNAETIAVLGAGLDHIYPTSHRALAEAISAQGLLISEFSLGTLPKPAHFPQRNRIISGLCRGVLVVEAALNSGSLITARHALEQNREVFAIPGSIHNPLARGCHGLIKEGAKLVEDAADILEELTGFVPQPIKVLKKEATKLDNKCSIMLQCIDFAPTSVDFITSHLGLTPQEVSSMLLKLEMQGYVAAAGGQYIRIK